MDFTLPLFVQQNPMNFQQTLPFLMDTTDSLSDVCWSPSDMTKFC